MFRTTLLTGILSLAPSLAISQGSKKPQIIASSTHVAEAFATLLSRYSVHVVELTPDEPDKLVDERALSLREAKYYFYDSRSESLRSAMYRERLVNHGVVAIDLQKFRSSRRSIRTVPLHEKGIESLVLTQSLELP